MIHESVLPPQRFRIRPIQKIRKRRCEEVKELRSEEVKAPLRGESEGAPSACHPAPTKCVDSS